MRHYFILFTLVFLFACGGQTKEELLSEGHNLRDQGNYRGAIVLYRNALEKDSNFLEARKGLAEAYLQSGSLDKAENEYKKVLLQNPSDTSLLLKLATVYLNQNKPQEALLELDKFHAANEETSESLTLYGRAHGAAGDLESAESFFKKALLIEPAASEPRFNLAKVYLQQKKLDRARELLTEVIESDNHYVAAYYLLAGLENSEDNRETALKVYQSLAAAKPKELQAHYMIGMLQMDAGSLEDAQQTVDYVLANFAGQPEGQRLKGMLLYRQGKLEEAVLAFSESLKNQQHLLAYFFLGLSQYSLDQLELALNQFQKALDLNPDFERARVLVAMTLLKKKRIDDAVIEIQKVLRSNPNNAYAHNILGSAYLARGDYDEGMAELELATELDPNLNDAHLKKGLFRLAKGEAAQGEADLVKAVEAAPEVLNSRLMLVTYYLRQKNYSAAIETIKAGLDGSKADALLNNYLAAAYFSQKNPEHAIAALNAAKQANPDYFTPYLNLAAYYASESRYDEAIAEYQKVVTRDPNNLKALLGMAAVYGVKGDDAKVDEVNQQIVATGTEQGFVAGVAYQLKKKNPTSALELVDLGLQQHPNSAQLLEMKGGLHRQAGQSDEAESAYIKLSGVDPERGNRLLAGLYMQTSQPEKVKELIDETLSKDAQKDYPYLLSASFLLSQQKPEEALNILQRGLSVVENPVRLQMQLAGAYERQGEAMKAESLYQQIVSEEPRFAPAYTALGFLNEKAGDKGKALDLYRSAINYDRKNVAALNNAAYLLVDNFGQPKEALELAMAAYRLKPSDPRIMDTLGYVLLQNERPKDAFNLLEKSAELLPSVPTVKLHLAMAHKALGNTIVARELLQEVIAAGEGQDSESAKSLLKTL